MLLNKYVRKLKRFKLKDDSPEGRYKMANWLLFCLQEEGNELIKSQKITKKEQVLTILYALEDKWLEICRRVPCTLRIIGWREFVYLKWKIVLLPKEERN